MAVGVCVRRVLFCLLLLLAPAEARTPAATATTAAWAWPATINVCPSYPGPIAEVKARAKRWRDRCYPVGDVVRSDCDEPESGIYLMGRAPMLMEGNAGYTEAYWTPDGQMVGALVHISTEYKGATRALVVEHELGHALGIVDDPRVPGDQAHRASGIMAPALPGMSEDDKGLSLCGSS